MKETIESKIENFEGDKRSKEYKDLLKQLEESKITKTEKLRRKHQEKSDKERILNFPNPSPWLEVKWLFNHYAEVFNKKKRKPCRCSGKINSMLKKLKDYYEEEK